jgi:hypothetical protein
MRTIINIFTGFFLAVLLTNCNDYGNKQNPLYGVIYREKTEVPQFLNYKDSGGSVIDKVEDESLNHKYGISHLENNVRHILIFEQFIGEENTSQPKSQILDTINIDNVKKSEYLTYCNCRKDTIFDPEIIAIVLADKDNEYYDKIIKAWRADTKSGKIILIKDTKGINCINEGYGL